MKNIFSRSNWATKSLAGALVLGMALSANAQPGNGGGFGGGGGNGGGGGGGGNRPNFQNMTPEQRTAMMAQMEQRRTEQRTAWLKTAMTAGGVTDADQQTAVIDFMTAQDKTLTDLRKQAQDLSGLLVKADTPAADLSAALKAYRDAVAAAKTKHDAGLADLDTKLKYSTNPRTETLLTLLGVVGTETADLGGIGEVFPDSPYGNRGGFGRGGQGGQGGRGGRGGGGNGGGGGGNPGN